MDFILNKRERNYLEKKMAPKTAFNTKFVHKENDSSTITKKIKNKKIEEIKKRVENGQSRRRRMGLEIPIPCLKQGLEKPFE